MNRWRLCKCYKHFNLQVLSVICKIGLYTFGCEDVYINVLQICRLPVRPYVRSIWQLSLLALRSPCFCVGANTLSIISLLPLNFKSCINISYNMISLLSSQTYMCHYVVYRMVSLRNKRMNNIFYFSSYPIFEKNTQ